MGRRRCRAEQKEETDKETRLGKVAGEWRVGRCRVQMGKWTEEGQKERSDKY